MRGGGARSGDCVARRDAADRTDGPSDTGSTVLRNGNDNEQVAFCYLD